MSSPTTLRSYQKDAISQLLPSSHNETEVGIVEPGSEVTHPADNVAAGSSEDVLSKPNLATQLVLGCYVATQKATGMLQGLDGKC